MTPARTPRGRIRASALAGGLVLLALLSFAGAQLSLVVDGRPAGEVRTDVVAGHSYAPADALAAGLGATLAAPAGAATVALDLGGHIVQIDVVEVAGSAQRAGAVRAGGRGVGDLAAVRGDDALWLPVTPVANALGAQVSFLPDSSSVVVVTMRPTLHDARIVGDGDDERLVLRLDGPASWSRFENTALGLTELHLRRARLTRARSMDGDVFRRVDLLPEGDGVRIRLDAPGADLEVISLPDGAGSEIRIRARPSAADGGEADRDEDRRVVLDADGADGQQGGRALALAVAERLRRSGIDVALTRPDAPVADRQAAGAGADLFASLSVAELPAGEVRIWTLGDAADDEALAMAVRANAATTLAAGVEDEVRRRVLLGLVPDHEVGLRYGRSLATALFQLGGYRAGGVSEAPLAVLQGAAGRGVLVEVSPEDLADDRLATALAAAIESALGGAP